MISSHEQTIERKRRLGIIPASKPSNAMLQIREQRKPKKPVGNRYGTRWRGKIPIPEKAHPLMREMFMELNRKNMTITEVAEKAGYVRGTISDWRYLNKVPSFVVFQNVLNAMGLDLKITRLEKRP